MARPHTMAVATHASRPYAGLCVEVATITVTRLQPHPEAITARFFMAFSHLKSLAPMTVRRDIKYAPLTSCPIPVALWRQRICWEWHHATYSLGGTCDTANSYLRRFHNIPWVRCSTCRAAARCADFYECARPLRRRQPRSVYQRAQRRQS